MRDRFRPLVTSVFRYRVLRKMPDVFFSINIHRSKFILSYYAYVSEYNILHTKYIFHIWHRTCEITVFKFRNFSILRHNEPMNSPYTRQSLRFSRTFFLFDKDRLYLLESICPRGTLPYLTTAITSFLSRFWPPRFFLRWGESLNCKLYGLKWRIISISGVRTSRRKEAVAIQF